ncbi:MAG: PilC/PilY family type IV pilus protein [Burkholderiaceae bacterium]|nr:PilC/PilY family type IV pilus protein [Burkholderiaceae bacterium]
MFKLSIKPIWLVTFVLLCLWALAFKLALAIPAFTPANAPVGYVAQDELTNYNLTSGQETLFRGQYEREYWGGNLIAYAVNSAGDISTATQPWNGGAAYQIELQGADRRIVTMNGAGIGVPFTWSSLSTTLTGYGMSETVLNYLRGVRTSEVQFGGTLRQRASALGDIIHSRPFYVVDSTNPTVFVGANDGMLHALNAVTGAERWAYVPSMVTSRIKALAVNPASGTLFPHDYYVDGSVNVATILDGTKRILVGGLAGGGKGLYALDITGSAKLAPATEAAAATNTLWEITPSTINNAANTAYANLGYTYAYPSIAQVGGVDAVIVGNGYNNGGDYQAYLYVINANTGALISAIRAGTGGTAGSPNGLSSTVAVDSDNDGHVDTVYAGDLNGTMWKFDLTPSTPTATVLLTTSPAQPITMTPGVARHPNGGYMVNFATGAMLADADLADGATFAAYGIWDGAPVANAVLLTQTLTERCYTSGTTAVPTPCAARVRTITANQPDWTSGATHHKGWRVALPAGEKVVGDGSFVENGRFYFNAYNPTVATAIQSSTVNGENWLMELDYLSGGSRNSPFLDLSNNHVLTDDDRVKDSASPPAPVLTTDGIPVGKLIGIGVMSQPILVQLSTLNNTLFNQNPDVSIPPVDLGITQGVTGGHFDIDYFYAPPSGGTQATATITVGTTGQISGVPATLGDITVDGVTIVPALTQVDLPNGLATSNNTGTIDSKVTNGFTASVSGNTITIKAPVGAQFNGKSISVGAGTEQLPQVPAVAASTTAGILVITDVAQDRNVSIQCGGTYTLKRFNSKDDDRKYKRLDDLYDEMIGATNGYTTTCSKTKSSGRTSQLTCTITPPAGASACSGGFTVDSDISTSTNTGPQDGTPSSPASGWTNFAPAISTTAFTNTGTDAGSAGDSCTSGCSYDKHFHQYDDVYDVTGLNMLNPSSSTLDLYRSIPSLNQNFKVLVHNQYLNPAVNLHIGDPTYLYNVNFGYVSLHDYQTASTLDLATQQTYRRDPNAVWPGAVTDPAAKLALPKPIGSLAFNMPLDALTPKDWWGNGDVRVGLHPTKYSCVWAAAGSNDGNMYQPVNPPSTITATGKGTAGWSSSTTPTTATGARHNGALVIQLIRDTTPNSAIELNVAGRPEYGWRVKSAEFSNYVLAEYATYWHHPNNLCYSNSAWTKVPATDEGTSNQSAKAPGSTDPKLGDLSAGGGGGGGGTITDVTTTAVGNVTTTVITYSDGSQATITRTANADGSVSIVTVDALGVRTEQTIANTDGSLTTGGDERGSQAAKNGRISWRELVAP